MNNHLVRVARLKYFFSELPLLLDEFLSEVELKTRLSPNMSSSVQKCGDELLDGDCETIKTQ